MIHDYYKGPYKPLDEDGYFIVTDKGNRAFDFAMSILFTDAYVFEPVDKLVVIDKLNGVEDAQSFKIDNLDYEAPIIRCNNKAFIIIRGWGGLTGTGALGLKPIVAQKIQDQFAQWIMDTLSK